MVLIKEFSRIVGILKHERVRLDGSLEAKDATPVFESVGRGRRPIRWIIIQLPKKPRQN